MRILKAALAALTLTSLVPADAAEGLTQATLYQSPECDCCEGYAQYLRENGSPGMSGRKTATFTMLEIADGAPTVYAVE